MIRGEVHSGHCQGGLSTLRVAGKSCSAWAYGSKGRKQGLGAGSQSMPSSGL